MLSTAAYPGSDPLPGTLGSSAVFYFLCARCESCPGFLDGGCHEGIPNTRSVSSSVFMTLNLPSVDTTVGSLCPTLTPGCPLLHAQPFLPPLLLSSIVATRARQFLHLGIPVHPR